MTSPLASRIATFLAGVSAAAFEELACEAFAHQFERNLPYRRYCQARGVTRPTLSDWREAPALPTSAFKARTHPLTTCPSGPFEARFDTSATTTAQSGQHFLPSLSLYEQSILQAWQALDLPALQQAFFLTPPPASRPHSSLIHMFGVLPQALPAEAPPAIFLEKNATWDESAWRELSAQTKPLLLAGPALAHWKALETRTPLALPPGSVVFETGGYKNARREVPKRDFYARLSAFYHLEESRLLNEYSMTELSSQAYAWGPDGTHQFPPWCQVRVMEFGRESEAPAGEWGELQLFDLANLESVSALRTRDLARLRAPGCFELAGRDPHATLRGCSLRVEL